MKKLISIVLIFILSLSICGCSFSSDKASSVDKAQSQNEAKEYISEKTKEIKASTSANVVGGIYITEDNRYIIYSNPVDNHSLYRYDKQTKAVKVLFNENRSQFLHSIKIYNNEIYFVSFTEQDSKYASLYKIDFEGENLTRIVENVGDDYILLDDAIYYTTIEDPITHEWFTMYKYDLNTKTSKLVYNYQSESLNYTDGKIYFVDYNFDGKYWNSGTGAVMVLDTATDEVTPVNVDKPGFYGEMYYFNEKLYFQTTYKNSETALICYDLKTETQTEIVNINELNVYNLPIDKISFGEFLVLDENLIYFNLMYQNNNTITNKIVEFKDGKAQGYAEYNTSGRLLYVNGNPVVYDWDKRPNAKINGAEYLNVSIDPTAA